MYRFALMTLALVTVFSCSKTARTDLTESTESEWLVDRDKVTGELNLFALADEPKFKSVSELDLPDDELVALVNFGNELRVYPYVYTNPFEVINDQFNGGQIAISYCPITKSGICFDRNMNGATSLFRASGYLFNDNLMPYDEKTQSIWSQMGQQAVSGPMKGTKFKVHNLIETKWSTVKESFSSAPVFVNDVDGATKKSAKPPPEEEEVVDGTPPEDGNYVYGIFTGSVSNTIKIFEYPQFAGTKVYSFKVGDRDLIVVGNQSKRIITSYYTGAASTDFKAVSGEFPVVMMNEANGSKYNIFGAAVSGPDAGKRLVATKSFVAIWWAWQEFYDSFEFNDAQ